MRTFQKYLQPCSEDCCVDRRPNNESRVWAGYRLTHLL